MACLTAGVVAVTVGEQNVFERDALLLDEGEELVGVVARVDERGELRLLVDEQVAVRLQGADDGGDDFHVKIPLSLLLFGRVEIGGIDDQRERPVVEGFDLHVRAELAGLHMVALLAADVHKFFVHRDGDLRPRGA